MKLHIFTNPERKDNAIKAQIEKVLIKNNIEIDNNNPEIVLYLGGDGTFLRAVEHFIDRLDSIKFIGINFGNLGFFYDYQKEDLDSLIKDLKSGSFKETSHSLLEARIISETKEFNVYAVNEIRVENHFHTLICDVLINGEMLETFHGNGLLVASALGSSAYNKSLGGAVVQPTFECMQLTEIATIQNNVNRSLGSSLIVNKNDVITLKGEFRKSVVGFDYLTTNDLVLKELNITISDKKVSVLHPLNYSPILKLKGSFTK